MPSKREVIENRYVADVDRAVSDYGDHPGIGRPKVIRWLDQFSAVSLPLAAKVLGAIRYYSRSNIQVLSRELVQLVYEAHSSVSKRQIFFVPIEVKAGSGSQMVARCIRGIRAVPPGQVVNMLDFSAIDAARIRVVVFFDDFSGTGDTITGWWDNVEPLVLPKGADLVLGLLVINEKARLKLEAGFEILSVDDLGPEANIFHAGTNAFSRSEKVTLKRYCKKTGCSSRYVRGYGDCGLLVAFKHGCPNNSLPILWHTSDLRWEGLFERRSI